MRPLTEAWVLVNRLRRRVGKPDGDAWRAGWIDWLAENAPGKTVADVGGLFGEPGKIAFAAEDAGAAAVTLFDAGDPRSTTFEQEREERGSKVRFVQGDLDDPLTPERVGVHDIVWCTGVLYHAPDPVHQLMQLRRMTGELLYLGCLTIPELPGVQNGAVFYPYLDDDSRKAHARAYWRPEEGWGIGIPFVDRPMVGHGNFWWGLSPSALRNMVRTARFEILEERKPHDHPWLTEIVARPIGKPPLLPPVDYFRRAGEARERGEPALPWEDSYDTPEGRGDRY